eukprot:CAMPEP_0181312150 /NCGR_PEP_ID=MMETSP1101-20121128/13534_1 /TAXON_ID=46948 /ORGANISM="Rhodomonas abbreviata, Strain Caron Lab Isolate" /LENGTH=367 /DNA_ID=CAMNT_0023418963 /DNA_START=216 /DNA_END=1319 /DNA_ORIENTATION=+
MGAMCASAPNANGENDRNKKIQRDMQNEMKRQEEIIKLLLLGAGESGKSTIFKQMKILYGLPYTQEELTNLVPVVHNNVVQNMLLVLDNVDAFGHSPSEEAQATMKAIADSVTEDSPFTDELRDQFKSLWKDEGVQATWGERSKYQVLDSLGYYMAEENVDRLSDAEYVPTKMDILQARVRTSGIVEEKYEIDGVQFTMFDVGGQRNERKKWIHCFDNVTAVIFVAAISEYDQVLYEDNKTDRMSEAIKLFAEICNSQWFSKTSMILFLNKSDLFREKLPRIPFRVPGERNEDFTGPFAEDGGDFEDAVTAAQDYILGKFVEVKRDDDKEIYHHITCATDTSNVEVVFNAAKDIILRLNLVSSGFMH